jgi:Predicted ester cyclase
MSDANKLLIRQLIEFYNQGAWDRMDDLMAADYVHHNNDLELSLAQFKQGAAWIRKGLPDFRIRIEEMVAESDSVVIRFVGRGTHLGSIYGEAPTSRSVALHGIAVYRIRGGRVAADWEAMDEHDLMKQIGAVAQGG